MLDMPTWTGQAPLYQTANLVLTFIPLQSFGGFFGFYFYFIFWVFLVFLSRYKEEKKNEGEINQ
jgi:hypothetical protein